MELCILSVCAHCLIFFSFLLDCRFLFFFSFFLINLFILFIYLAVLGLRCCVRALSSCGERGLLFGVVHGLLIAVASLVA